MLSEPQLSETLSEPQFSETRRKVPLDEQPQSVTLKGEAKDMQAARDTQNHAAFALHTGREDR